jgi:DNA/RNA endonuclease YhcR with UshA esterase domain
MAKIKVKEVLMVKKIWFSILVLMVVYQIIFAEETKIIQWNEAHKYYGKYVTIEGIIVHTHNTEKACFLNFHEDYKKHFTAVIFRSDFSKFPPNPEEYYYNKKVQVSGIIEEYHGKPEIILKSPTQIKIIEQEKKIEVISWEDADKYYGKEVIVEGKVVATHNSGKACFLNFHKNWERYFTAVIFKSDLHKFPNQPEEFYKNKKVRIKGIIKKYKGKPEIILKSPLQIEIIQEK